MEGVGLYDDNFDIDMESTATVLSVIWKGIREL